ncbi:MAG TPA: HlyD family efflux transporter periplasmic adaptor subunit [Clostridia bacterium]|nr:HlyD family efflux transporter periplasmic adaptor subunit [Clostridia bacterium]
MNHIARQKKKVKTRFYIFVGILAALIVTLVVLLTGGGGEGVLSENTLRMEMSVSAASIRDETIFSVDRYDRVEYLVNEGAAVTSGTAVAEVYKWGYSDEMAQSVIRAQRDVLKEQETLLSGIANPGLENLMLQIDQKKEQIVTLVMKGGTGDLLAMQNELTSLLEQRAEYLKTNVQPSETLTALYAAEQQQLDLLAGWRSEVTVVRDGVVSFYFDGYEDVLNVAKLDNVNADLVTSVIKGAAGGTGAVTGNLLYRMVDSGHWYIAFVTQKSAAFRVTEGEQYTVVFEGYVDRPYMGTALKPIINETGVVNLIEFNEDMGSLLNARSLKATIQKDATGFDVPLDAISVVEGIPGIELVMSDGTARVEVEVLAVSGDRAVIRARNAGDTLGAGQRYERP